MNTTRVNSSVSLMRGARNAAVLCALATLVVSCGERQQQGGGPPPPAVTVAKPVKRTVSDFDEYVGRFTAVNSVEVRARVSGYLDGVHFKDGQIVKQGDLLFTIDKRPFQNTLEQARANLVQAKSNLAFTESDYTRGQQLVRDKTITDQTFEQRAQAYRNAQASVSNNEAAVRQAELDIEFTELRAPVNGRIGDRRVSPGNLVTGGTSGNTTLLATIVSTEPIYFEFTFDEASFLRYERLSNTGNEVASRSAGVQVTLKLIDERDFEHQGRMDFVDNVIDRATGTIRGRAVFANPNNIFTPGMFARVRMPASPPSEALLVPDAAIGTEQVQKYLLVVDAENTTRQKYIVPRPAYTRRLARYQGRARARRPRGDQRADAGAGGHEGAAAGAGRRAAARPARRRNRRNSRRLQPMRISHFFIDRPIFASVVSIVIVILGAVAFVRLPVAQYPEIAPPTITVAGQYPGASADVVASTVVTPIEQQINGVENMLYLSSNSTADGKFSISVTFDIGTNLDIAQVQVQNRVAIAQPRLPADVRNIGVTVTKSSPDLMMVVHLYSPDKSRDPLFITNYATLEINDALTRVDGVGSLIVFGSRDYAMRIWLDPDRLQSLGLTANDVVTALQGQNVQVASGTLDQPPVKKPGAFQIAVQTLGRLADPDQFANIVVKQTADRRGTAEGR